MPKAVTFSSFRRIRFCLYANSSPPTPHFLGLHLCHMEVPRLRVELEMHLPAYFPVTATPDLSRICNLPHSPWQHQIPDPLSKTRG